jgi:inosose dehydratase
MAIEDRIAGAPISWGVCEVPGWGHQMSPDRVFSEMRGSGLAATEAGPEDFLPWERGDVKSFLVDRGLGLVGGFVPTVLHRDPATALNAVRLAAQRFVGAGGTMLVLAAGTGSEGYDERQVLSADEWATLTSTLDAAVDIAAECGAVAVLHPHMGTLVENGEDVQRVLEGSRIPLCVDTGHLLIGGVDPAELVRDAVSRVAHIHFKDVDAGMAARVQAGELSYTTGITQGLYCALGQGDVDVKDIVNTLEGHGYTGWYVLEQDLVLAQEPPEAAGPVLDVEASREYLIAVANGHQVVSSQARR